MAQDFEPEYIAVSDDASRAYVSLQENNAVAVIDLDALEVTAVNALGYKGSTHETGKSYAKALTVPVAAEIGQRHLRLENR